MSGTVFPAFGIPRWDQPLPDEHPAGLMLRLSQLNHFSSVSVVERETGIAMSDMKLGRKLDRLALLVDSDEQAISASAFSHGVGSKVVIRGQQVALKRDLSRTRRRVCPTCIAISPHARFWWDLAFVTSCPSHGCLLEGRCTCPSQTPLGWRDGRVGGCRACDTGNLAAAVPKPAPPSTLAIDTYLLGRLGVGPGAPEPVLDALPLFDAVDVLERVGALSIGGYSKRWMTAQSLKVGWGDLLAEGYAVLDGGRLPEALGRAFDGGAAVGASPSLTTAYGWFYHWLNGKGGRAFSPGLMAMVLKHAETRFVVNKLARAEMLPPTETCTLVEATVRCGVSRGVMRDILEQRGLLSRTKVRGQAFRIPETEIRAIEAVMRDSIDIKGAVALLGTQWKVVKDLTALGVLVPWVSGGRLTKHAYVYQRADVQAILDRLSLGLPSRLCTEEDETTLTAAAYAYSVPLAVLCREALEGRLGLWGRMETGGGLQGVIVRRDEVLEVRRRVRAVSSSHRAGIVPRVRNA